MLLIKSNSAYSLTPRSKTYPPTPEASASSRPSVVLIVLVFGVPSNTTDVFESETDMISLGHNGNICTVPAFLVLPSKLSFNS